MIYGKTLLPVAAALLLFAGRSRAAAQTGCPQGNVVAQEVVEMFITEDVYQEQRQAAGTTAVDATHLRVLNDVQDAAACSRLWAEITAPEYHSSPWLPAFYTADGYYFIAVVRGPVDQTRVRVENGQLKGEIYPFPFAVYDSAFRNVLDMVL
jgi:hypothetical protein